MSAPPELSGSDADVADGHAEEAARADVYGLLATLFYAPPDTDTLATVRAAPPVGADPVGALDSAWHDLVQTARAVERAEIADEFETLFGGFGKPAVYLFGSHYLSGFLNEKPLAWLRDDLSRLGLVRLESVSETEDHFAYLCEVMRHLIVEGRASDASLADQRVIFERHIAGWVDAMCDAIRQHPAARFYAAAALFARAFAAVERDAFEMLEAGEATPGWYRG